MKKLPKLHIKLDKSREYEIDLGAALAVDDADLGTELMKQPYKYAWFAALYEMAKGYRARLRKELKDYAAKLDPILREPKMTEAQLKAAIQRERKYSELEDKFLRAEEQCGILQKAVRSFEQRKDCIMALNANLRKEHSQY